MKVAILGGALNPVTIGHIRSAQLVLEDQLFDEVWLMPCYDHMYAKKMASSEQRRAMCELAVRNDPRIKVFDYEIKHQLTGGTYKFVKKLFEDKTYKKHSFSLAIGLDNALMFESWANYKELKKTIPFVVLSRKGYEIPRSFDAWFLKSPHIYLQGDVPKISSTLIRAWCGLQNKIKLMEYLDPLVLKYIQDNGLYGLSKT